MKYKLIKKFSKRKIQNILLSNKIEEYGEVALSLGEYCLDFEYAQKMLLKLFHKTDDDEIKSYCVLGLAYLARRFEKLSNTAINIIEAEALRESKWCWRAQDALDDVKIFLKIDTH